MKQKTNNGENKQPKKGFFEKINNIDKSLVKLNKEKNKEKMTNMKNERKDTPSNPTDLKRVIRGYQE